MQSKNLNTRATIHDGQRFSFYKNAQGKIPFSSSIHPGGRSESSQIRKRQRHKENLQARREANIARNNSKSNPNWHGIGLHAGVKPGF